MKKIKEKIVYDYSSVSYTEYDYVTKTLVISFKVGTTYSYDNVLEEDYINLSNSDSIGKAFHQYIRGKYEIKKFEDNE